MLTPKLILNGTRFRALGSAVSALDAYQLLILNLHTYSHTGKMRGKNARDYITTTIRLLMNGNENYDDLVPMSMAV